MKIKIFETIDESFKLDTLYKALYGKTLTTIDITKIKIKNGIITKNGRNKPSCNS
jgi:hypothetical protein